jgi:hypothetical protein
MNSQATSELRWKDESITVHHFAVIRRLKHPHQKEDGREQRSHLRFCWLVLDVKIKPKYSTVRKPAFSAGRYQRHNYKSNF